MLSKYLKNIPIFSHLREADLEALAKRCKNLSFNKGDIVFYSSTSSTDLYIVLSGRLKAVLLGDDGGEIVLSTFRAGDFFGELSLIDGKGRSATIVADEASSVAVLQRRAFFDFLLKDPKIAIELMIILAGRLRKADEMIESLAFLEVSERLLKTILEIARTEGVPCKDGIRLERLTHRELAGRVGASREAVSKCMKGLISKGIIKEEEGSFIFITKGIEDL